MEGIWLFYRGCSVKPPGNELFEAEVPGKPWFSEEELSRQRKQSTDAMAQRRKCSYFTIVGDSVAETE